ncbi:MAG TPA: hypothetical protein VGM19_12670 [Armatimonadota bacterium]
MLIGGALPALERISPAWLVDQGLQFAVITCPEDEARWESERLAAFTRQLAHSGLEAYVAPAGYGKVLDADPATTSLYLHTHPQTLQIDSRGRRCARACPNDPRYLEWFANSMRTLAWLLEVKGFVWDAPGFYHSRGAWACHCSYCQRLFSAAAGQALPRELTPEVLSFRRHSLSMFILAAAAAVQSVDRRLVSIVAPPPPLEAATALSGADDWKVLAANSGVASLALVVTPEGRGFRLPGPEVLHAPVSAAHAEGKQVWLWIVAEQLHPELLTEGKILAANLGLEAVIWADYEALRRSATR